MLKEAILDQFQKALNDLADDGRFELAQQGHRATGKGINSLEGVITRERISKLIGVIMAEDYLVPVDTGVAPGRVPYGRGRGSGGKSKYIEGLLRWIRIIKPGLSLQERRGFAFAIANTHRREGMPPHSSVRISKNVRRTNWIQKVRAENATDS